MNKIRFFIFILTISTFLFAQEQDSLQIVTKETANDSLVFVEPNLAQDSVVKKERIKRPIFVGVDLYQPLLTALTEKSSAQAFVNVKITGNWHLAAEVGFESDTFDKLGWNVDASGTFYRLGFNYFMSEDVDNASNGFYAGLRLAYSPYNQTINQYTIRAVNSAGEQETLTQGPLPETSVSAFWVEPLGGARVQLFNTNFYADVSVRLQLLLGGERQDNIEPLMVPGFGKDVGGIQANLFWGISYQF